MLNPFVSGVFLIRKLLGVGFFDENEMLQNKSPIIYMTYYSMLPICNQEIGLWIYVQA